MIDVTNDGGIRKSVITPAPASNAQMPTYGSRVWIHYTLRLLDGTILETSEHSKEFSFRIGSGHVIRGLELLVLSMKLNEACTAHVAPEYAFGARTVTKTIRKSNNHGKENGALAKDKDTISVHSNQSATSNGIAAAAPAPTTSTKTSTVLTVPHNAIVQIDLRLLKSQGGDQTQNLMGMNSVERLNFAKDLKEEGNKLFKEEKYVQAAEKYEDCLKALRYVNMNVQDQDAYYASATNDEEVNEKVDAESVAVDQAEVNQVNVAALNNLALCKFKIGEHNKAEAAATLALSLEPDNPKSLFYRGRARTELGNLQAAREDLIAAIEKQPDNKRAQFELEKVEKKLSSQAKTEKKVYAAMFSS